MLTSLYLPVLSLLQLLCPSTLSYDWQLGSVPLVTSVSDTRNMMGGGVAVAAMGLLRALWKVSSVTI